jgi:hypothetical protein
MTNDLKKYDVRTKVILTIRGVSVPVTLEDFEIEGEDQGAVANDIIACINVANVEKRIERMAIKESKEPDSEE